MSRIIVPETPLIPPAGSGILDPRQYPRVLRRTDQPGDSSPFLRSAPGFRIVPRPEWDEWIEQKLNLSSQVWSVLNQRSVGSCASESACGALKIVRRGMGLSDVEMNPYGIYGRVNGGYDSGSTLAANLKFIRDKGAFPESVWSRSHGWRPEPSEEAYDAAWNYRLDEFYEVTSWEELASALLQGWVIYWGYSGHAIVGVDLLNDSQFIYLNSWGEWGQGTDHSSMSYGFGVASRSQIIWGYGVYAFRTAVYHDGEEHVLAAAA